LDSGAAAISALAEKPEVFNKTLIYLVFIEAIAIYGLVIAFMIMIRFWRQVFSYAAFGFVSTTQFESPRAALT